MLRHTVHNTDINDWSILYTNRQSPAYLINNQLGSCLTNVMVMPPGKVFRILPKTILSNVGTMHYSTGIIHSCWGGGTWCPWPWMWCKWYPVNDVIRQTRLIPCERTPHHYRITTSLHSALVYNQITPPLTIDTD